MSEFTQSNFPTQHSSSSSSGSTGTQVVAHGSTFPSTYTIGGVRVEFPAKAYPSQLAMMNKVSLRSDKTINMIDIVDRGERKVGRTCRQFYVANETNGNES